MNVYHIVLVRTFLSDKRPKFHPTLTWQYCKVVNEVLDLLGREAICENVFVLDLLNHSTVLVDTPLCNLVKPTLIDDVLNRHLSLVSLAKVSESNSTLQAYKALSKIEKNSIRAIIGGIE